MTADRLLEGWSEDSVSWNSPWTDAGADGSSSRAYEAVTAPASATGWLSLDVTPFVQAWADGSPNHGIVLLDGGTDGVEFDSSESENAPVLSVGFTAGVWDEVATQELEGTSANATFASQSLGDGEGYVWNVLVTNCAGVSGWARADASFRAEVGTDFPGQPEVVSPAEGATGISLSPALEVEASDPSGGPLDVTFYGRGGAETEEFAIIVLPDTQKYALSDSANQTYFLSETQWIAANLAALNIVFVTHVGDVVDDPDAVEMWQRADLSMSVLQQPGSGEFLVPCGIAPGNHDLPGTYGSFPYYND